MAIDKFLNEYHSPVFPEEEFERRHDTVRDLMDREGVDVLLLYGNSGLHEQHHAHIQYLSGYLGHGRTYLVFFRDPAEEPTLFWGVSNHGQIAKETCIFDDVRWGENRSAEVAAERIRDTAIPIDRVGLVGISSGQKVVVPHHHYETLNDSLRAELVDLTPEFERLRYRKSELELEWFRRGAELTDIGMKQMISEGQPGMTEYELASLLESAYLEQGGDKFVTFLSSAPMENPDPGQVLPWKDASARTVETGDVVTTEVSAAFHGYPGQVHRPIAVGTAPNEIYQDLFSVALDTYKNILDVIRPGNTAEDVVTALAPTVESEFKIYDVVVHGFGQLLQPPYIGTTSDHSKYWPATESPATAMWEFEAGQVLTVQPNVVTEDERYGLQFGTTVIVREGMPENIHDLPEEFLRMDA